MELVAAPLYLLIAVGLVVCFFGYRLIRLVLVLGGTAAGFLIGVSLVLGNTSLGGIGGPDGALALVAGVIGALLGGAVGYLAYPIVSVVAGLQLGSVIGAVLISIFNAADTGALILFVIGLVIGVIAAYVLTDLIVMLATSVGGAWLAVSTYLQIRGLDATGEALTFASNPIALIVLIVLAALGFIVQRRMYADADA
ncbi:MAG: DUF4203 domain-containing protein [Anaerolineae bacterium]